MTKSKGTDQKGQAKPLQERPSLLHQLKVVVSDYLDRKVDEIQLRKKFNEVDKASQQLKTVQVSTMSLKDVERTLSLKFDGNDDELERVLPIPLPSILGKVHKRNQGNYRANLI
jgi:hypothetical protein